MVAYLPEPIAPVSAAAGAGGTDVRVQLLSPQPGTLLKADRTQHFEVVAPAGVAVAVGSEQSGWVELQQQQPAEQQASSAATSAGAGDDLWVLSAGNMVLPRISTCYVAVQGVAGQQQQQQQRGHAWVPVLGLPVRPPVRVASCQCVCCVPSNSR